MKKQKNIKKKILIVLILLLIILVALLGNTYSKYIYNLIREKLMTGLLLENEIKISQIIKDS